MKSNTSIASNIEPIKTHGMVIGFLDRARKTYRCVRRYPADVARKLDAYGIDAETVGRFPEWGVETVVLEERRGQAVREYTMDASTWTDAPVEALGDTGLPHAFVRLAALPKPVPIRKESCQRRCLSCGKRCAADLGHQAGGAHECPACGEQRRN